MKVKLPGSELVDVAVDEVIMKLSVSPKVDAIGFTGSVAFGLLDEHSDIDMICVVNSYMSVEERRELLGPHKYSPLADTVYQETFEEDGTDVDIQFRERKWFEDVLANKQMASDFNEKYVLYMLQNVVPAFDRGGVLSSMVQRAGYDHDFRKRKLEGAFAVLKGAKGTVETLMVRSDVTFLDRTFVDILEKYASAIFALNGKYFSDVKWGTQKMEGMQIRPHGAIADVKEFCTIGNSLDGIAYKVRMLRRMLLELADVVFRSAPDADISGSVEEIRKW
jgi:hypothetical protein